MAIRIAKLLPVNRDNELYAPIVIRPASYDPIVKTGTIIPCACVLQGNNKDSLLAAIRTLSAQGKTITGWTISVRSEWQ